VRAIRNMFVGYVLLNAVVAGGLFYFRRLSLSVLQWSIFTLGLMDALLFAALSLVTGGFDSPIYWVFPGLILHNALSIPLATPQIALNLAVCVLYLFSGFADMAMSRDETNSFSLPSFTKAQLRALQGKASAGATNTKPALEYKSPARPLSDPAYAENPTEQMLLRLNILLLMSVCCYGLQALVEKQRRAESEAEEFMMRQSQLEAAGRLAAEIAHQIKNPLGIINTAAYSLQKALAKTDPANLEQLDIIREEVGRADRIITELMGYAQLAEGRVERLNVVEELDRAVLQVFPTAARYAVEIEKDYAPALPSLLMQRGHLAEVFVNLLQNAREAMNGVGRVRISTQYGENYTVVVTIADTGPGVSMEVRERIFEPYFTTKKKGTGLGLAIVKHNVEIYGGSVRLESELGKGTAFILELPAKAVMRLNQ
jgi:nitrogen-specific signal transduction histidine kinase